MVEVSLLDENLRPFLTALGWLVGYQLDDGDWAAITHGFRESDAEAGRWYEYEFTGRDRATFSVAQDDSGGSIALLRVDLPQELAPQVKLLAEFCRHFYWRQPGSQ